MRHNNGKTHMFVPRLILGVFVNVLIFGVLLFVPARTLEWWRAWVFIGVVVVGTVVTVVSLLNDQDLLNERLKPLLQKGQPLADKIIVMLLVIAFASLLVFIPLDVFRFHLLGAPSVLVSSVGLVLVVAGWWIISLAFKENTFAAPVVKHQEERNQTVVDTGVYGVVRHPMYAGAVLLFVGLPLWLESYASALFASVPIGILALRIIVEEQFLKRELEGYDAYTKKVQYRLIPFVW